MSTQIQQGRYDRTMRRVGDLKGPGSKVAEVLSEVFPVVDLERLPPELFALGGTVLAFGGASRAPAAAEFGRIQVFNPLGSGKILTVTSAVLGTTLDDGIVWGMVNGVLGTVVSTQRNRDQRLGFVTLPVGQIATDSTIGVAIATGQIAVLASDPLLLTDENGLAVLPPGFGFEISSISADITVRATFFWRERVMEPSEINL